MTRGQNNEAWLSRWRDGACPVHGRGFVDDTDATPDGVKLADDAPHFVKCSVVECDVRATRYPGEDAHHASFGWRAGPDNIRGLLAKAGDIDGDSSKPGKRARVVRTSYPLELK